MASLARRRGSMVRRVGGVRVLGAKVGIESFSDDCFWDTGLGSWGGCLENWGRSLGRWSLNSVLLELATCAASSQAPSPCV